MGPGDPTHLLEAEGRRWRAFGTLARDCSRQRLIVNACTSFCEQLVAPTAHTGGPARALHDWGAPGGGRVAAGCARLFRPDASFSLTHSTVTLRFLSLTPCIVRRTQSQRAPPWEKTKSTAAGSTDFGTSSADFGKACPVRPTLGSIRPNSGAVLTTFASSRPKLGSTPQSMGLIRPTLNARFDKVWTRINPDFGLLRSFCRCCGVSVVVVVAVFSWIRWCLWPGWAKSGVRSVEFRA